MKRIQKVHIYVWGSVDLGMKLRRKSSFLTGNAGLNPYLCTPFVLSRNYPAYRRKAFYSFIFKPKTGIMNNYELMVIFTPVLSEEDFKLAQKKYTAFISDNGGVVVHENPWGLKSLAYPIQKKTTGLYWVLEYD